MPEQPQEASEQIALINPSVIEASDALADAIENELDALSKERRARVTRALVDYYKARARG